MRRARVATLAWLGLLCCAAPGWAFEVNEGDVFAAAPLGVARQAADAARPVLLAAPVLGVRRADDAAPAIDRMVPSPVLGVHVGAGIEMLAPGAVDIGPADQLVEVFGFELAPTAARVVPAEGVSIAANTVDADGTRAVLSVGVAADAAPGLRRLELFDAAGNRIPPLNQAAGALLIRAPVPVIESITPSVMARGDTAELVIRGRNLRGLPFQETRVQQAEPEVLLTPATGIDLGSAVTVNDAGTEIRVPVSVAVDAVTGARRVQVRSASGISTDQSEPANTLNVVAGPLRSLIDLVSPLVGVRVGLPQLRQIELTGSVLGVAKGPTIVEIQPGAALQGETLELRLSGTGLDAVEAIAFVPVDGLEADPLTLSVVPSEARISLRVAADAPIVPRRVIARLAGGVAIEAPRLFSILQPAPEISAITPKFLIRNGQAQTFFVQGRNLAQVQAARLMPADQLVLQEFMPLSDATARMVVLADPLADRGERVLQVFNQTLASSSAPNPFNTLQVVDEAGIAGGFAAALVGVRKPIAEPETPSTVPLPSAALGVSKGPLAFDLNPGEVEAGQAITMTVTGQELEVVERVRVVPEDDLSVAPPSVAGDGTSLTFEVLVGASAAPGERHVLLEGSTGPVRFRAPAEAAFTIREPGTGAPAAAPDFYVLPANGQLLVDARDGVLSNDTDSQGQPLFAALVGLPTAGALILNGDGGFVYTPEDDFAGVDSFRYVASNGAQASAVTRVELVVEQPLDAVDDAYSVFEGQSLIVDAASGLLANDRLDPAIDFELAVTEPPVHGTLEVAGDGSFEYLPSTAPVVDEFAYRLVTPEFRSLPAQVRIEVIDVNNPPVANDDDYLVEQNSVLEVPAALGVLANDLDPDSDILIARVIEAPAFGSLVLAGDGGFRYTPQSGFSGTDGFRYEVADPAGLADSARVTIVVNDRLVAVADQYTSREDEILLITSEQGLLVNDSALPTGELRIEVLAQPVHGTLEVADDGSFIYRPRTPDFFGLDEFIYRLRDDLSESNPATVSIEIEPVNDPPEALADSFIADENVELNIPAPGVLENDIDSEGEPLTASLITDPEFGQVTLNPDGSLSYVPEVNFRGIDRFFYEAVDAEGAARQAGVEIVVTQPPTATNDVYFVDVNTPLEILDPDLGLLINDHDAPEDDELTAALRDAPLNGLVDLQPDGTFVYIPNADFVGIDVFTYEASDGKSSSNPGSVTLAVGITSFPRAIPDAYEIDEDSTATIAADEGVLINDLDADTPPELLEAFLVDLDWRPFSGSLDVTVRRDGGFTVRPWPDFSGETFFVYQVFDGTDISNAAVVTLDVIESNDGVDAVDDQFGVLRNTVFRSSGGVRLNDEYDHDFPVAFEVVEPPALGQLVLDPNSGSIEYTPDPDFSGTDSFTYRLFQIDTGIDDVATATLRVNGAPIAVDDVYFIDEDTVSVVASSLLNDLDPDGDVIEFSYDEFRAYRLGLFPRELTMTLRVDMATQQETVTLLPSDNFYGEVDLEYSITDGELRDEGIARIMVAPVPEAPIASPDEYLTPQDTPLIVNDPALGFTANDFDPDFQPGPGRVPWRAAAFPDTEPLMATLVQATENGQLLFSPQGIFSYTPNPGFSGPDRFTYFVTDATGRSSEVVEVEIIVNTAPVATDDNYVVNEDVVLEISAADGVLANDSDIDGDPLRARFAGSSPCGPCNGQVSIRADGSFTYTPNADFNGTDQFGYRVDDGVGGFDTASVTITVLPVNDAPRTEPDTYRVAEDETLIVPEPQGVLRNDDEVDGDGLNGAELLNATAFGTVELQTDGAFSYVPDPNFFGVDEFTYRVFDGTGLFSDDRVEIRVTPVNDNPVAEQDSYTVTQDQMLAVAAAQGLLANDSDVDSDTLIATMIMPPSRGIAFVDQDGAFDYTPDPGFSGVDRFTYQVDDGLGAIASADVLITVEPVQPDVEVRASDDFYAFEGPALGVTAPGVLANDEVTGAAMLEAQVLLEPEFGSLVLDPDGGFTYLAPDGFEGVDGFSYTASADGTSDIARVTFNITSAVNNPPRAQGEDYLLLEDEVLDSSGVFSLLDNDTDFENDPLSVVITSMPDNGELELFADGHFIYWPAPDFNGEDELVYRVSDGRSLSSEVVATLTVIARNDPPEARDDFYSVPAGQTLTVAAEQGLLANDRDVDSESLHVEAVDNPRFGVANFAADGSFEYQPAAGFDGVEEIAYSVTDLDASATAMLRIAVNAQPNLPPVATGEALTTDEDVALAGEVASVLLGNDSDPDGDALAVVVATEPEHGRLVLADGEFRYEPDADFNGIDGLTYQVSDGLALSEPVSASIEVIPVNDAPRARFDSYRTGQGEALEVDAQEGVLSNDSDVESDPLTATPHILPVHGSLTLRADGGFRYVPDPAFSGRDEFTYLADDGLDSTPARVAIDVEAAGNRAPHAVGEQFVIAEDTVLDTRDFESLLANDSDPDGDPISLRIVEPPAEGTLELLGNGHARYVPMADADGADAAVYVVSDGIDESTPVELQIMRLPVNDRPRPANDLYRFESADEPVYLVPGENGVLQNDTDPDGDALFARLESQPDSGAITLTLDGAFEYRPGGPVAGEVRWRYLAVDPAGQQQSALVTLLIGDAPVPEILFEDSFE